MENTVWMEYSGLVPMSPYTIPRAPSIKAHSPDRCSEEPGLDFGEVSRSAESVMSPYLPDGPWRPYARVARGPATSASSELRRGDQAQLSVGPRADHPVG